MCIRDRNIVNLILASILALNLIGMVVIYSSMSRTKSGIQSHHGQQAQPQNLLSLKNIPAQQAEDTYLYQYEPNSKIFNDDSDQSQSDQDSIRKPSLPGLRKGKKTNTRKTVQKSKKPALKKVSLKAKPLKHKAKKHGKTKKSNPYQNITYAVYTNKQFNQFKVKWAQDAPSNMTYRRVQEYKLYLIQKLFNQQDFKNENFFVKKFQYNREKKFKGFIQQNNYCINSDLYHILHPENVEQKNIFTNYHKEYMRELISTWGHDIHNETNRIFKRNEHRFRRLFKPAISVYITMSAKMHSHYTPGKSFMCFFQMYNFIPGTYAITRKDTLVRSVNNYADKYEKANSTCFKREMFLPRSFRLYDYKECKAFFQILDSEEYANLKKQKTVVYIRKISKAHRGEGVRLVDEAEEQSLRTQYNNGKKCGKIRMNQLVQRYIDNPLLVEGHKFDFRIYLFIASTDPLIVYYHDGFLRVSLPLYDPNSKDLAAHLTNTYLSKKFFAEQEQQGKSTEELRDFQMWNFTRFHNYLVDSGKVNDTNWLDNYLRPLIKLSLIHI
eukprot:TRINITY_DN1942_c0_g1_i2.p1 TRINITY_DN1942_c0_g1~~TRINITY_DN1942_c0_g1_i2.p1  ORF type:complete len:552 (+),score=85.87 TRINITY_DN1942_c0_g1_i2:81-1736(+)